MRRPYLNSSIDELESEFEKAGESDQEILTQLSHELTFRKTPRARELARLVGERLGPSAPPSPVRARPQTPPPVVIPRATSRIPKHKPTSEQQEATEAFLTGGSLKTNAFAGTGKTSTLELLAHATSKRGQYLAFNKSIVNAAEDRFPRTVNCSTSHSLAYRATPSSYRNNSAKMTEKVNGHAVAELLNLRQNWRIDKDHTLRPVSQGSIILKTIQRFTHSAAPEISVEHVPLLGSLVAASESTVKSVQEFAVRGAQHIWGRMQNSDDKVPLGHDGYLKLWALSNPVIAADFILLDEAQDTNPVLLDVLRKQSAQMIYVGDKYQQIYEWRGAINAMEEIKTDASTNLTMSFRFGPAIAQAATKILALLGETTPIRGNPQVASRVGPTQPGTILARTNAATITAVIEALDDNKRPHLVGGNAELMEMLRGVEDLKQSQPSSVADFFGFENWPQVVEFAKSGEGEHLLTFVNLVESRGEKQLMWALNRTVEENLSDVIISTAHKAKGREWSKVRLMDDFLKSRPRPGDAGMQQSQKRHDPAELRLFYVALTRAQHELEVAPEVMALIGLESSQQMSRGAPVIRTSVPPTPPSRQPPTPFSPPKNWQPPNQAPAAPKLSSPPSAGEKPVPKKRGFFDRLFGD